MNVKLSLCERPMKLYSKGSHSYAHTTRYHGHSHTHTYDDIKDLSSFLLFMNFIKKRKFCSQ